MVKLDLFIANYLTFDPNYQEELDLLTSVWVPTLLQA